MELWPRIRDGILPIFERLEVPCISLESSLPSKNFLGSFKALAKSLAVEVGDRVEVRYDGFGKNHKLEAYEEKDWFRGIVVGVEGLMTDKGTFQVQYDGDAETYDENVDSKNFRRLPSRSLGAPEPSALIPPRHLSGVRMLGSAYLAAEAVEINLLTLEYVLKTFYVWQDPQRAPEIVERVLEDLAKALWELRGRVVGLWPDVNLTAGQEITLRFGRGQERRGCTVIAVDETFISLDDRAHRMPTRVPRKDWPERVELMYWPGTTSLDVNDKEEQKVQGKKRGCVASCCAQSAGNYKRRRV